MTAPGDPVHRRDGLDLVDLENPKVRRAISTDILHFRARVPVFQVASGCYRPTTLISDTVLPDYSCNDGPLSSQLCVQTHGV